MDKFIKSWRKSLEKKADSQASSPKNLGLHNDAPNKSDSQLNSSSTHLESHTNDRSFTDESDNDQNSVSEASCVENILSTTKKSKQSRKFLPEWKKQFIWLSYNDNTQKAFCSFCTEAYDVLKVKMPTGIAHDRAYESFVKNGFSNWNKANERFKGHENSNVHRIATTSVSLSKSTNVSSMISNQMAQDRRDGRSCLVKIFESIRFLAVQGLALRGSVEENSNFIQLLHLRSKDDPLLKAWMDRSKYKWISHDIINEILSLMSLNVQRILLLPVQNSLFYAVMADGTTDASRKEQMSINFRTVDDNLVVHETFLGFYESPATDASSLLAVLLDALLRFDLKINKCRGQCYDGAYNMSGEITGLQTRIRELESRAYYVHCAGHNLSLVAQDGMKLIAEIADLLSVMRELITFVRASAKCCNIFKNIQSEFKDDDEETPVALKPFCPTRWTVRVESLKTVVDNYKNILEFCDEVGLETSDCGIKARGFSKYLRQFETYIFLRISIATLEKVEALNETIQSTSINFNSVIRRVDLLKTSLNEIRSDGKFHKLYETTLAAAKHLKLEEPVLPRRRVAPKRLDSNTSTYYFPSSPEDRYKGIYFQVIDQVLTSIDTRFDSETYKILGKMQDFALNKCEIDEIKGYLMKNHNGEEHCDFDLDRLVLHRNMFLDILKNDKKSDIDGLTKIVIYLQEQPDVREFVSEYTKFIKLLLTYPQTVCIAERSFSSLRRLKNYIRATMTQQRINDVAILHVHREVANSLDLDIIVDEFIYKNNLRMKTFASLKEL